MRDMRCGILATALSLVGGTLGAQRPPNIPELRVAVGASVPAGALRDDFRGAPIGAVQGALQVTPRLHIVGTGSVVAGRSKYAVDETKVTVLQLDVGVELGAPRPVGGGWSASPFVGAGAGVRAYDYRSRELDTRTGPVAYATVGGEMEFDRGGLRVEAREQLFRVRAPIAGAETRTRGDVVLLAGLTFHLR